LFKKNEKEKRYVFRLKRIPCLKRTRKKNFHGFVGGAFGDYKF